MTNQEPKLFTVQLLLTGRPEVIVYHDVYTSHFENGFLKLYSKQGYARIREVIIDVYEDTSGVEN